MDYTLPTYAKQCALEQADLASPDSSEIARQERKLAKRFQLKKKLQTFIDESASETSRSQSLDTSTQGSSQVHDSGTG